MIEEYNFELLGEDLQKILRIQDWDIEFMIRSKYDFVEDGQKSSDLGLCRVNRLRKRAQIWLNKDSDEHKDDLEWFSTLLHELYHVLLDPYSNEAYTIADGLRDDNKSIIKERIDLVDEQTAEILSRGMLSALGENYLNQFKRLN